jgi:hypothetical protein
MSRVDWSRLAVEVCEQGVVEDGVVGGSSQKQSHAGPESQIVGVGEDLVSATTVRGENKLGTGFEPGPRVGVAGRPWPRRVSQWRTAVPFHCDQVR